MEDIFTQDFHDILDDPDIDIVISKLIGGTVARDVVLGALPRRQERGHGQQGAHGHARREVMRTAEEAGKEIAFEASVGGGIPIIDPMKHSLIANRIDSVMGIVNGDELHAHPTWPRTTCPMPTYWPRRRRGLRRTDPPADVDGLDAAAKIAILASIAFNSLPSTCTPRASATSRRSTWNGEGTWATA